MNVLVMCRRYPFPLTDGEALRIYNYVRHLGPRHSFDLLCLSKGAPPDEVARLFRRVETVAVAEDGRTDAPLRRLVEALSVDAFLPRFPEVAAHLRRILAERDYDLIWTATDFVHCIGADSSVPVLVDVVDDMVLQTRRELLRASSARDFLFRAKSVVLARAYEKRHFAPWDACMFVADEDAKSFLRFAPDTRVEVIANGVDGTYFTPGDAALEGPVIVFEGSMSFGPNADAAAHLCEDILPRILEQRPDVRVKIVGRDPTPRVQGLASERVAVTGFVPDVRPYLREASVFLCPLRMGAGIKNKILQAWAMGKAVVATPESVGGLKYVEGENLLVRDGPRALATAVLELLADPARRRALGARGRATVEASYTWEAKAAELERVMTSIVARRGARVAA